MRRIVHPLNSAGFRVRGARQPIRDLRLSPASYLKPSYYSYNVRRDGVEMTFVSAHRPLSVYTDSLADAGLLIERLGERAPPDLSLQSVGWSVS